MSRQKGFKHSEETKAKLSAIMTGRKMPAEVVARVAAANTGKKRSPETKAKISAAITGRHYKLSPEAVANIAISQMGHKVHENTKEAISKYKNGAGRKVVINGMPYRSMAAAAKELGITYRDMVVACRYHPERAAEYGLTIDWVENKGE